MTIAICSISGHEKNPAQGLMPARERYIEPHIAKLETLATLKRAPFLILSGLHGLLTADEEICHYDYRMCATEVASLAPTIFKQLRGFGCTELHFYTKLKPDWEPYRRALQIAADSLEIRLHIHELSESD